MSDYYPFPNPPVTGPPPAPYGIPPRVILDDNEASPPPYTNLAVVKALIAPYYQAMQQQFNGGCDASLPNVLDTILLPNWIQAATDYLVKELRFPMDWCYRILFIDGPGSNVLALPDRNIRDVLSCYIRVLPSNVWYKFTRPRNVNGREFFAIGGQVGGASGERPVGPEPLPVLDPVALAEGQALLVTPTGIEDADLYVDTRRRSIKIPPRVLYAGVSVPLWNYTFNPGALNIEVHYTFGFPPTKYTDGSPLALDDNGILIQPKAGAPDVGVDWSSGMPTGVTFAVAQVAANMARRAYAGALSMGVSSISVDGASESYGGAPFGGDLTAQDKDILDKAVAKYRIVMVL